MKPTSRQPPEPDCTDLRSALETLLLDTDGLASIEARLGGFNIFEAIGHTRTEQRHSDFLAFLLDPYVVDTINALL